MKSSRISRTFRTFATVAALAGSTFIAAPHASAATTQFGTCDFGTPSITNFRCVDSDDLKVRAGAAFTDNGPFSDMLDIDWYVNQANARVARIHGGLQLQFGYAGTATMKTQCLNSDGSIDTTRTVTIATSLGIVPRNEDASFTCASNNLSKVRVTVRFVDALGSVSEASGAREFGD